MTQKQIGTKITILESLGKGSFGSVSRCTDEFGASLAIKSINSENEGIPCLMEASIMSTISHPYLHSAVRTHATPSTLHLVSELAITDLSKWTRLDKEAHLPDPVLLRAWCHSLLQAVACLHRQDIIHADIKAANILLFSNNIVRLGDFTLSVRKWNHDAGRTYNHTICTYTHRPPEVWVNREWDFPVDIWALGCSLYEIAYGELLIPCQGHSTTKENAILRERVINCILDWAEYGPGGSQPISNISRCPTLRPSSVTTLTDDTYHTYSLSPRFNGSEYRDFNRLLCRMLQIDPQRRASASELLQDPYFAPTWKLSISPYSIISTSTVPISTKEVTRLTRYLTKFTQSEPVIRLSLELYSRCIGLQQVAEYLKLMTMLWIASKLVLRSPIASDCPLYQIFATERIICTYLSFRLHMASNSQFTLR